MGRKRFGVKPCVVQDVVRTPVLRESLATHCYYRCLNRRVFAVRFQLILGNCSWLQYVFFAGCLLLAQVHILSRRSVVGVENDGGTSIWTNYLYVCAAFESILGIGKGRKGDWSACPGRLNCCGPARHSVLHLLSRFFQMVCSNG